MSRSPASPLVASSRPSRKRWPSTDAVRSSDRQGGDSRSRRRPITSRRPSGTRSSAPSAASPISRTSSRTNSGLPLVRRWSAAARAAGGSTPVREPTRPATSDWLRPSSAMCSHSPAVVARSSRSGSPVSTSRYVPATSRREPRRWRATNRSSSSDAVSAHWRSSMTSSRGWSRAVRRSRAVTSSKSRNRSSSAPAAVSPRCHANSGARRVHGQRAGTPSPSQQVAQRTRRPRSAASRAACSTSRDLPMPGSPLTRTNDPSPAAAASAAASSPRMCCERPTKGCVACPLDATAREPTGRMPLSAMGNSGTAVGGFGHFTAPLSRPPT